MTTSITYNVDLFNSYTYNLNKTIKNFDNMTNILFYYNNIGCSFQSYQGSNSNFITNFCNIVKPYEIEPTAQFMILSDNPYNLNSIFSLPVGNYFNSYYSGINGYLLFGNNFSYYFEPNLKSNASFSFRDIEGFNFYQTIELANPNNGFSFILDYSNTSYSFQNISNEMMVSNQTSIAGVGNDEILLYNDGYYYYFKNNISKTLHNINGFNLQQPNICYNDLVNGVLYYITNYYFQQISSTQFVLNFDLCEYNLLNGASFCNTYYIPFISNSAFNPYNQLIFNFSFLNNTFSLAFYETPSTCNIFYDVANNYEVLFNNYAGSLSLYGNYSITSFFNPTLKLDLQSSNNITVSMVDNNPLCGFMDTHNLVYYSLHANYMKCYDSKNGNFVILFYPPDVISQFNILNNPPLLPNLPPPPNLPQPPFIIFVFNSKNFKLLIPAFSEGVNDMVFYYKISYMTLPEVKFHNALKTFEFGRSYSFTSYRLQEVLNGKSFS